MINLLLSILVFIPIAASTGSNVEPAQAANVDFAVQVCATAATCGDAIDAPGAVLVVTNETHPNVSSTRDGLHIPYSAEFPIPADGGVFVQDVPGGMFDVYVRTADGATGLLVQPVTTFGNGYVVSFNVMLP